MFEYEHFSCDVDIFRTENDLIVRFYDKSIIILWGTGIYLTDDREIDKEL